MENRNKKGQFKKGHLGYWLGRKRKPSHGIFLKGHKKIAGSGSFKKGHQINKGKPCSKETKEKIRNTRNAHKEEYIGEKSGAWKGGKPKCAICKKTISYSALYCHKCSGKIRSGENSMFWKGGKMKEYSLLLQIRKSREYNQWRKKIFERDNYICQKCKIRGGCLQAHHIYDFSDYPKLRLVISNGITFCKKCHKLFHNIYGRQNNTKEQVEEFLLEQIVQPTFNQLQFI